MVENALDFACKLLDDKTGTCPYDNLNIDPWSEGCEKKCGTVEPWECWKQHLKSLETPMRRELTKQIKLTRKQKAEFEEICDFFMEATEPIEDPALRAIVSAKILSRLGCFTNELVKGER